MKNQNTIILVVILMLLVGGGSFGIGYKVAQAKTAITGFARNGTGQFTGRNGIPSTGGQGMMRGNRQTIGDVIALDDKSVTVKMADGSSRIVLLSSTVAITKSVDAPKTDLKVGSKVAVFGTNNTDGSVTATTIELDPKLLGQTQNLTPSITK